MSEFDTERRFVEATYAGVWKTMNKERQEKAANRLEELAIAMKDAVKLLRMGQSDAKAYALVYLLRREVGYVVNQIGRTGVPNAVDTRWANNQLDSAIWNNDDE